MTKKIFSLFLYADSKNLILSDRCYEITPTQNDIFCVNEQLIRCVPDLDPAVIVLLKRSLQFKEDHWFIKYSLLHQIKLNDVHLLENEEQCLQENQVISMYEQNFVVQFGSRATKNSAEEQTKNEFVVFEDPQDINLSTTEHSDNLKMMSAVLEIPDLTETRHKTLSFYAEPNDILKELEQEYNMVIIDPNHLMQKPLNHKIIKGQLFENMNYFEKGQLLCEESTEDIIDGKLGIDDIETLLGSDFNNDLFQTIKNDDILMLFENNRVKQQTASVPSLTKKEFYCVTLHSPLDDIHFQVEKKQNGEKTS